MAKPICLLFFFFQAEGGIRFLTVTGVQTCPLPISTLLIFASSATDEPPYFWTINAIELVRLQRTSATRRERPQCAGPNDQPGEAPGERQPEAHAVVRRGPGQPEDEAWRS